MIRIAVCDDDKAICGQIEKIIIEYCDVNFIAFDVEVFYSGVELCNYIQNTHRFDIIFLDIEMPNLNGIETSLIIRSELQNKSTHIVFISREERYCRDLFALRPTNFFQKPVTRKKIIGEICFVEEYIEKNSQNFVFQINKETSQVPYKDIIYFEINNRIISLVTVKKVYNFYEKFTDLFDRIKKHRFVRIHNSFIVNYDNISHFKYDQVEMINSQIITISQSRRKKFRELQKILDCEDE